MLWAVIRAFFLFCTAMAVPVALLIFGNWNREGALLLAGGLLISTIGFEFMTNALRQGVSLAFLLGAFHFEKRLAKFSAIAAALLLHDSSWFFAPLVILLAYNTGTFSKKMIFYWAVPVMAGVGYLFSLSILSRFGEVPVLLSFYGQTYVEGGGGGPYHFFSISFLLS